MSLSNSTIKEIKGTAWLLPAIVVVSVVVFYPLLYMAYLSFFRWDLTLGDNLKYIRFENYTNILEDVFFWRSIGRSLGFTLLIVPVELLVGFFMAIGLNYFQIGKVKKTLQFMLILPYMMTSIVIATVWKIIFNNDFGILNWLLSQLGLPTVIWLGNPVAAFFSVALVEIWRNMPFVFLITTAGLLTMPKEIYEAAKLDGAGKIQTIRYIILPQLRNTLLAGGIFLAIDAFRVFDTSYVLTQGGPGRTTEFISIYIFNSGFKYFKLGQTAAQGLVLLGCTLLFILPLVFFLNKSIQARK